MKDGTPLMELPMCSVLSAIDKYAEGGTSHLPTTSTAVVELNNPSPVKGFVIPDKETLVLTLGKIQSLSEVDEFIHIAAPLANKLAEDYEINHEEATLQDYYIQKHVIKCLLAQGQRFEASYRPLAIHLPPSPVHSRSTLPTTMDVSDNQEPILKTASQASVKRKAGKNEDGFMHPRKVGKPPAPISLPVIPTANNFSALAADSTSVPALAGDNSNLNLNEATASNPSLSTITPKLRPPPPIFITNPIDPITLFQLLEFNAKVTPQARISSKLNPITKKYEKTYKIQAINPETYRNYSATLNAAKAPWYTYSDLADIPLKVIIKGIPEYLTQENVKKELLKLKLPIISVQQFRRYATKEPLPIFAVTVPRNELGKRIFSVKELLYFKIYVEDYRRKPTISQCHRCQGFWHSSHACKRPERCFKCAESHSGKECKKLATTPGKCCNCNGEHIASWRGCPVFPKSPSENPARPAQRRFQAIPTTSDFPALATGQPPPNFWTNRAAAAAETLHATEANTSPHSSAPDNSFSEFKEFLTMLKDPFILNMFRIFKLKAPLLRSTSDPTERFTIFLEIAEQAFAIPV